MTQAPIQTQSAGVTSYDGFISYSHAADGLLAPRLQSGLQRFAKPWWKRRAVRIFRDESSLSANPHLWSSITEALDNSAWFVVLLSPDAAQSEWVNQEIAYWVANRDAKRILPVVTDGSMGWTVGDVAGDAVPEALRGVFSEEPRWVDLRFARQEKHLDLQDPRFADAVADIASTIRAIPKDELASVEVLQHRRTVRTAWAAGALVAVLAVAALGFGVAAGRNSAEAERQRQIAAENAGRAEAQAESARRSEASALRAASVADGRRLLAAAAPLVESDPELAMLLALEASHVMPDGAEQQEALDVVRSASSAHRLIARLPQAPGPSAVAIAPDGGIVYHVTSGGDLLATDVDSGDQLWGYSPDGQVSLPLLMAVADVNGTYSALSISPNGARLALAVGGIESPGRIHILDALSGVLVKELDVGECQTPYLANGFSPDGRRLVAHGGGANCMPPGHTLDGTRSRADDFAADGQAYVFDTRTWELETIYTNEERVFETLVFASPRSRALATSASPYEVTGENTVLSYPGLEPLGPPQEADVAAMSPTGDLVALADTENIDEWVVRLYDVRAGEVTFSITPGLDHLRFEDTQRRASLSFSADGRYLSVIGRGHVVIDLQQREIVLRSYGQTWTYDHAWASSDTLVTAHSGELHIWGVRDPGPFKPRASNAETIDSAAAALTRGFDLEECATYLVDPCPTFAEMQRR